MFYFQVTLIFAAVLVLTAFISSIEGLPQPDPEPAALADPEPHRRYGGIKSFRRPVYKHHAIHRPIIRKPVYKPIIHKPIIHKPYHW